MRQHPAVVPERGRFWHFRFSPSQPARAEEGTESRTAIRLRRLVRAASASGAGVTGGRPMVVLVLEGARAFCWALGVVGRLDLTD